VSGATARLAAPPGAATLPIATEERESALLRLVAFVGLAAFGVGHWWGMVVQVPAGRAVVIVAVATAGGGLLALLPRLALPRPLMTALATAITVAMLLGGLAAAGLSLRMLLPGNWSDLADGLDRGLSGIRTVDWPYDGPDSWVRLTILLGAPLLLTAAAALAFWPARRYRRFWRAEALVALLVLYGVAVTNHDPGSPLTRGFVLLLLVAAWLWLPRLGRRDALVAGAATVAAGIASLPVAAALDGDQPWWDYRSFDWFGSGKSIVYDWNHSYGPLNWPRDGTTLLNVKSSHPLYWKTEALDRFDGVRWLRVREGHGAAIADLPTRFKPRGRGWNYFEYNPRWDRHIRVTVRSLRSDLVVGPGTIYEVAGAGATATAEDGTTFNLDQPLEKGDSYTVAAYAPKPTAAQMRGAPTGYPAEMTRYTELTLPDGEELGMPLRGDAFFGTPGAARALERSSYSQVYDLARRITDGSPTAYDAVARVERYLQRRYTYDESPPRRSLPLAAFLLRDRVGYCQQFSGAMALMLRMVGIPSRVATGFTPGSYNSDTGEFRVRDLDAHSWVEVFVTGIGWVTFDPTPPAAPAQTQSSGLEALGKASRQAGDVSSRSDSNSSPARGVDAAGGGSDGGGTLSWWLVPVALLLGTLAVAGWLGLRRLARGRPTTPEEAAEAQLRELESALRRLGWRVPGGTTLSAIEGRLRRIAGPAAAGYAARLRAHRYEARAPDPPDRAARRDLRAALASAAGKYGRLRALVAIPPGGPFRRF
jgi:transglutaminase-like putative cysteine protease